VQKKEEGEEEKEEEEEEEVCSALNIDIDESHSEMINNSCFFLSLL
jgi:hypothetical protein